MVSGGIMRNGFEASVRGSITVSGSGIWEYGGAVDLIAGSVLISNGGRVRTFTPVAEDAEVRIGVFGTYNPQVVIDGTGSIWDANGHQISIGETVPGTLSATNGGQVEALVLVGPLGHLRGNGTINGNVWSRGVVSPGLSAGALHVNGSYTQGIPPTGELSIELAAASSYDQLLVTDTATLANTLTVNLINGFVPSPGQTFTILTADDVDGEFAQVNLPKGMQVIYTATSVILQMPGTPCPADINNSGAVDVDDLIGVILGWGTCANCANCPPDTNDSCTVDVDDLIAVILGWGACP